MCGDLYSKQWKSKFADAYAMTRDLNPEAQNARSLVGALSVHGAVQSTLLVVTKPACFGLCRLLPRRGAV